MSAIVVEAGPGRHVDIAAGHDATAVVVQRGGDVQRAVGQRRDAGAGLAAVSACAPVTRRTAAGATRPGPRCAAVARRRTGIGRRQTDTSAIAVAGVRGAQRQVLGAGLLDGAAAVLQRLCAGLDAPCVQRALAVVDVLRGGNHQFAAGADRAGVGKAAARVDPGVGLGLHRAVVFQAAIGGDDELADLRADGACVAHADTMLGPHQHDLLAVHAAERADVQREGRRIAAGGRLLHLGMVDADLVAAGGDL
ncbi:hypothetical protein D9M68_681400 [compost metagenome]